MVLLFYTITPVWLHIYSSYFSDFWHCGSYILQRFTTLVSLCVLTSMHNLSSTLSYLSLTAFAEPIHYVQLLMQARSSIPHE